MRTATTRGGNEPATADAPADWQARPWRFAFRVGEFGAGSVTLRSLVLRTHFIRLIGGPPEPVLPFDRFPAATDVAIANSYPVPARLPRLAVLPGSIRYVPAQYPHHYIDLSGTYGAYLEKFSSKSRWTLRKKVARFAESSGGSIAWRAFSAESMDEFHRLASEVSGKTYQSRLLSSGLPDLDRFRIELSRCDDARAYILFHAGEPVAFLFCPARGGNLVYEHVGYDPEYQRWSPGTVLQSLALESLFAEGRFRTFDFTEGDGDHKRFFANRSVDCADLFYFRKTLRNMLILGAHAGLHVASRGSVHVLDRVGLRGRLKKLIRSKA